jgi:ABC-type glycerol-3-phosphate transport system substrate-binding protein
MIRGSTASQGTVSNSVDFDWGFTSLPAGPGGRAVTQGGGSIAMGAKASLEEKAAAWKFLRWLTGTEQSAEYHMATGYMPTRWSCLELPSLKAFHQEHPTWLISVQALEWAKPTSCIEFNLGPMYHKLMTEAVDRITISGEDVQQVLTGVAEEFQKEIDAMRARGELIIK